jgi:hypothetical protein
MPGIVWRPSRQRLPPGAITSFQTMFDRIMENSMAMWMLVSALFPIVFFGILIKAFLHYRRTRAIQRTAEALQYAPPRPHARARAASEDWVPSR